MTSRDVAWAALHDPTTDATALGEIAQAHPEFSEAVLRHPNCYDELREWIAAYAAPDASVRSDTIGGVSLDQAGDAAPARVVVAPPRPRWSRRALVIGAAVAAGILLISGVGAWTMTAMSDASGGDSASGPLGGASRPTPSSSRTLSGPPIYIGDELDWLMLSDGQARTFFSDVGQIVTDNLLSTVGETEGEHTDPAACFDWFMPGVEAAVGTRLRKWTTSGSDSGSMQVYQFATVESAGRFYRARADTLPSCGTFRLLDYNGTETGSTTLNQVASGQDAVVVDERGTSATGPESNTTHALLLEGNLVLDIWAPRGQQDVVDPQGLLAAMVAQAATARARLTDEIGYR